MKYDTKNKWFNIINDIITFIEEDKWARMALAIIFGGLILLAVGLGQTKAGYITHTTKKQTVVWGYKWGNKAITLNKKLIKLGYSPYHSALIINKCKKFRKTGVVNCIIAVAGVGISESGGFEHCYRGQCMGVKIFGFKNLSDDLDDWFKRYNKYWYTWRQKGGARFFYSINGRPSLSRYCTEEQSSGMKKYSCPNGYRTFNKTFNYLTK